MFCNFSFEEKKHMQTWNLTIEPNECHDVTRGRPITAPSAVVIYWKPSGQLPTGKVETFLSTSSSSENGVLKPDVSIYRDIALQQALEDTREYNVFSVTPRRMSSQPSRALQPMRRTARSRPHGLRDHGRLATYQKEQDQEPI